MTRTVFIFHGTGGYPEENWFPWLKGKLKEKGCKVIVPQFPTPEHQTLENWFRILNEHEDDITDEAIMIGHSLGGVFLLRILEKYKIAAGFFVGTPIGIPPVKNWEGDKPFTGHPFDWNAIRGNARHFTVFHSDNDPYVSLGNGKELAEHLGVELTFISGAGHFNTAAGYASFPALFEKILPIL